MKKVVAVLLLALVGVLTACGGSKQPDKETQGVIDSIVKEATEVSNNDLEKDQKPYKYTEKGF